MKRAVFLSILGVLLLAGCNSNKALILESTPSESNHYSGTASHTRATTNAPTTSGEQLARRSRGDWADAAPISSRLDSMGEITRITVHHSGEVNEMNSEADIVDYLRRVQTSQCRTTASGGLGAGDLSYHFIIDRNGEVWEGRSLRYQGAHAGNSTANRGNVGICVLGNFNVQHPNERQRESLKKLLSGLMTRYRIGARDIYTHREIKAYYGLPGTECPGVYLQTVTEAYRQEFLSRR